MRSYALLRELVRDCGATLVAEEPGDQKKARHLVAVFEGRTHTRFRLSWDRKEDHGVLEVPDGGDAWLPIGPTVRKGRRPPYSNLHEFMVTAERLCGTRDN